MNQFYKDKTEGLTNPQISMQKKNNFYLYMAFSYIFKSVNDGETEIGGELRNALLSGRLPKKDEMAGVNSNKLGEKIKFLTLALSDKQNVETFKNSYFYKSVQSLLRGYTVDVDNKWSNFKKTAEYETAFRNKNSFDVAIICQRDDNSTPLGLDFIRLIDTIIKTDEDGKYYIDGTVSVEEELEITEAIDKQLETFQTNKRFCRNYLNPKSVYSSNDYYSEI